MEVSVKRSDWSEISSNLSDEATMCTAKMWYNVMKALCAVYCYVDFDFEWRLIDDSLVPVQDKEGLFSIIE